MALDVIHAAAQSGSTNSVAFSADASLADGDQRIVYLTISGGATVTGGTAGWTPEINGDTVASSRRLYVYTHTHSEADTTFTFTLSSSQNYGLVQVALRDHDGLDGTPVVASSGTSAATLPAPSMDATLRGAMLLTFYSSINNSASNTIDPAFGMTVEAAQTGNGSVGHSVMVASEARPTAGRTGANPAVSDASAAWVAASIVVSPAVQTAVPVRPYFDEADWMWDPIDDDPALDPDSAAIVALLGDAGNHSVSLEDYATKLVHPSEVSGATPRYDITFANATGEGGEDWGPDPFAGETVPIPSGVEAEIPPGDGINDPDGHVAVGDDTSNRAFAVWQAVHGVGPPETWDATWGGVCDLDGDGREDPAVGKSTGSGLSRFGLVVREAELAYGQINHALFFGTNMSTLAGGNPATNFRYPATSSDGVNNSAAATTIEQGSRVQLDPSIDLAAISGITEGEIVIGRALQQFGAYCGDNAGGTTRMGFVFEYSPGTLAYSESGLVDNLNLTHIPWDQLRVLETWDGGGEEEEDSPMTDYDPATEAPAQVLPFENLPSTDTPLTAEWLNHVDAFLADIGTATTGRVAALEATASAEGIRDTIGAALVEGSGIDITVSDGGDTITIAATGGGSTDAEIVRDTIGTALTEGTGIDITVSDVGDTITLALAAPRVVAMTDGATITPNADTTDIGTVTLGGNRAMAAPSGTPVQGQKLMFRIKQDGTGSRTLTWNSIYRFSAATAPTLTTTAGKIDYVGFIYNSTDTKWDCIAERLNF